MHMCLYVMKSPFIRQYSTQACRPIHSENYMLCIYTLQYDIITMRKKKDVSSDGIVTMSFKVSKMHLAL